MTIARRTILKGAAAGFGTLAAPHILRAADGDTIRIALITSLSGPAQLYGNFIKIGATIAADRLNAKGGVLGKKIELIIRDDKGSPDGAVTAFRELTGMGIKLVAQGPLTAPLLATLPLLEPADASMVMIGPSSASLTHENFNPNAFRLGFSGPMAYSGFASVMARKYPDITRWAVMATETDSLKDLAHQFTLGLKREYPKHAKKEVEVLAPLFASFGAADYKNQISSLMDAKADGLFNVLQGADAISYYKQARTFGVENKYKIQADSGNELSIAKALGRNTPKEIWGWTGWYQEAVADNPVAQEIYKDYVGRTKDEYPNWFMAIAHDSILAIANGAQVAGSTDRKGVLPAIAASQPLGATGKITFRKEDQTFVGNLVYIKFGADASDPKGWRVFESVVLPGADFVEPATPGKKLS